MKSLLILSIIISLSYSAFSQNFETNKTIEFKSYSENSGILIYSPKKYFNNTNLHQLTYNTPSIMVNSGLDYQDNNMNKLLLPTSNFIAVYNSSMNNYTYYNYPKKSYFDNNRVKTRVNRSFTNNDSFNPYGANSFENAIILGLLNSLSEL